MKEFKVEVVYIKKDYASVVLEATNRREALEKAKKLQRNDFSVIDRNTAHEWKIRPMTSFYNMLVSFFGG